MTDNAVERAVKSIADGIPVDWSALDSGAISDDEREYLECLQILDRIAEAHRLPASDSVSVAPERGAAPDADFCGNARFTVERCLGSGAFGTVYQAYDGQRRGRVALKVLHRVDPTALYRLKQEFRALADLSHPNLASLYELSCEDGRWFISMELIDGCEFVDFVLNDSTSAEDDPVRGVGCGGSEASEPRAREALGPAAVARLEDLLRQLAEALVYLHAEGRLHRDIKPANVLVTREGRVVLLDFGLVTGLGPGRDETSEFGTPGYMSPEHGTNVGFTAATDWYSVGVMLFKSLTGSLPFDGSITEVISAKRARDAPEPRELVPDVPAHLNELCRRLLSRLPSVRLAAVDALLRLRATGEPAQPRPTARATHGTRTGLVGRGPHLHALLEAFEAVQSGRAVTVYMHGGSGLGKTALMQCFLDAVRERDPDAVVLSGRCFERESVPYKALDGIVDALSRYLRNQPRATVEALLPRDVPALTRVFPVLRRVPAIREARQRLAAIPDSHELRRRAFGACRELFARLGGRHALVMGIDDLQWGDADSSTLLAELLRPPDAPMLLLVATYRSEESDSSIALQMLLHNDTEAQGSRDVREIVVGELPPHDAEELADRLWPNLAGQTPERTNIVREAGGNPYLIAELVRFARGTPRPLGSEPVIHPRSSLLDDRDISLDDMILTRVRALPEPARRLLEALSVFGQPLDSAVACLSAGVETHELEACALLRAERLSRIRISGDREEIETYHDRIRETIVRHLSPDVLKAHHRALALALESVGADPEVLTVHFQGAGDNERATGCAIAAADRAADALAFERASRLYRLALDLMRPAFQDRHPIEVRLGDALARAGRGRDAAHAYLSAASSAKPAEQLELWRRSAEQLLRSGHLDEGYERIRAVLGTIGMELASSPRRALLSMFVRRARLRLRGLRFQERDASQVAPETLMRIDACWSVAMGLGIVDHVRGADFQARHILWALEAGDLYRVARAIAMEIAYASVPGTPRARRRVERLTAIAQELADRVDDPQLFGLLNLVRGTAANMQGDWKQSFQLCQAAEAILRERCTGVGWELAASQLYSLLSLVYLGDVGELSRRLPVLIREARGRNDLNAVVNLRARLSYIPFLAADDLAAAQSEVREGIAEWSQQGFTAQHYFHMHGSIEVALFAGDGLAAWSAIERSWPALRRSLLLRVQSLHIEALSLRARAAIAVAGQNAAVSADRLRVADEAIVRIRRTQATYGVPLADVLEAGCRVARSQKASAIGLLERAARGFDKHDMPLHAAAARRRLGETGHRTALTAADQWMTAHGIANPRRMAAMLAPGPYAPE